MTSNHNPNDWYERSPSPDRYPTIDWYERSLTPDCDWYERSPSPDRYPINDLNERSPSPDSEVNTFDILMRHKFLNL